MKLFLVALFLAPQILAKPHQKLKDNSFGPAIPFKDLDVKIINGHKAAPGQFPWEVGLFVDSFDLGSWFCGGTLISDQWILTAGHCVEELWLCTVQLGSVTLGDLDDNRVIVTTTISFQHENYTGEYFGLHNDIGLIQLEEPIEFTDFIKPIALHDGAAVEPDVQVTVSGWGLRGDEQAHVSNELYFVNLTTISNEDCSSIYDEVVIDSVVCAKGNTTESTCSGDSGSPVVIYTEDIGPVQIAIVSFGHIDGCEAGIPVGFTRTANYRQWIRDKSGV